MPTDTTTMQSYLSPEYRRSIIGVSELAACMGLDPWRSALDVYNLKRGLVEPFAGNRHTERGNELEDIAARKFGEWNPDGRKLRRYNKELVHPEFSFIRGHIDRVFIGENKVGEIKCVSRGSYAKMQREGLPYHYIIQNIGYQGLGGFDGGEEILFCADAWDLIHFPVSFSQEIFDAAISAAAKLWNDHIIPGIPPEMVKADEQAFEFEKIGGDVTVRDDEKFVEAMALLADAKRLERDSKELTELAQTKFKEVIENTPGRYQAGAIRATLSQSAGRKTFDKKALAARFPEMDLEPFEKQGKPFDTLRVYLVGE